MNIKDKLTYANVVSTLCLFLLVIGVGGTAAYAHGLIGANDIKDNAVRSAHIKDNAVRSAHIKNGHVRSADIRNRAVKSRDIKNGTVNERDLARRTEGVALAGGTFNHSDELANSFNRLGGHITVEHPATGEYEVTVPGASFDGNWSEVVMTVMNGPRSHCFLNTASDSTLFIICYDNDGTTNRVDDWFKFVLYDEDNGATSPLLVPPPAASQRN